MQSSTPQQEPVRRRPVYLAASGDANDPATWSGTPYHFLDAARARGLIDEGLRLDPRRPALRRRRWVWNLLRVLSADGWGGYQNSIGYLESLWAPVRAQIRGSIVINNMPLYPPSLVADPSVDRWYYIDATLALSFAHYRVRAGRRIRSAALQREREGYASAAGVAALSSFAARSVVDDYGIAPERVHVLVPGANITAADYAHWEKHALQQRAQSPCDPERPLRFVVIGLYWQRKGLDWLLRAMRLAQARGLRATLRVVGCQREELPTELRDVPNVEWLGRVSKRTEPHRFLKLVSECDVGCLLSRAEMAGIAAREYLALGLITLATRAGGLPDMLDPTASLTIAADASDAELAQLLLDLERDVDQRTRLAAAAWDRRYTALWSASMDRFLQFWPHPSAAGTTGAAQQPPAAGR